MQLTSINWIYKVYTIIKFHWTHNTFIMENFLLMSAEFHDEQNGVY